jgi:hypothetical protein
MLQASRTSFTVAKHRLFEGSSGFRYMPSLTCSTSSEQGGTPVSSSNLVRLSGLAAVLGSVLFLGAELLSFVTETEDFRRGE